MTIKGARQTESESFVCACSIADLGDWTYFFVKIRGDFIREIPYNEKISKKKLIFLGYLLNNLYFCGEKIY